MSAPNLLRLLAVHINRCKRSNISVASARAKTIPHMWRGVGGLGRFVSLASTARASDVGWRPSQTMYCSDGEFDWDSGQSLYDFVIQTDAKDDFIVSYLGIPHPSFETRDFFHIWLKMRGQFSSARARGTRAHLHFAI